MIKLYDKYFQKSKVFLYPLTGMLKNNSSIIFQTYIEWNDEINYNDCKLICVFEKSNTELYKNYINLIHKNNFLINHYDLPDKEIFIFNLKSYNSDWKHFLNGKYSKFSTNTKSIIKKYNNTKSVNFEYIDSYINPHKYYNVYSELLDVSEDLLESTIELCDKYDADKEKLIYNLENLTV